MTESTDERWLTYAEAGALLGISAQAARMFAKRHNWARRTPNAYGERAQVLVPVDAVVQPRAASYADRTGYVIADVQPGPNGHDQVNDQVNVRAIEVLNEQLGVANRQIEAANQRAERAEQRIDDERKRADTVQAKLDDAMTAERIARDEAAGLRARLDQLQARGLWARLRNKR